MRDEDADAKFQHLKKLEDDEEEYEEEPEDSPEDW